MELEIISYVFVCCSMYAAYIMSHKSPTQHNAFIANSVYLCSNIFGIIFMYYMGHYAYLARNIVFTVIAIRGVYKNK